MTIEDVTPTITYTGSGTTGPFAIPFYFLADSDIVVVITDEDDVETTLDDDDYTLTGAGDEDGGSLTLDDVLHNPSTVTISRATEREQPSNWGRNDPFPAVATETALDRLTMIAQELHLRLINAAGAVTVEELIEQLLIDQDFIDLLTQTITNTLYESNITLQLGVLRYQVPMLSEAGAAFDVTLEHASGLVTCTNAAPVSAELQDWLDDDEVDIRTGDFVSFKQGTVGGQVTVVAPPGGTLDVPTGFLAKTRALNSIITAACTLGEAGTWTITGDLAVDE